MKKKHLFLLATVAMISLSGCTKDKPKENTPPTLAVIEPDTSETISDKLDDPSAPDLEVETAGTIIVGEDGKVLSESEVAVLESESAKEIESRAEEIRATQETAAISERAN